MPKKIVFIGHPIGGDIKNNIKKVLKICSQVHTKNIIPAAPYLISLQYLNDKIIEDRKLGMEANHECFYRRYVDELWLFGNRISAGMEKEILLAKKINIPIIPKTKGTKQNLKQLEKIVAEKNADALDILIDNLIKNYESYFIHGN